MLKRGVCLAAAVVVTAPAVADSIDLTWRGRGAGETVLVTHNDRSMRTFAGELRYQFAGGEGAASRFEGERAVLRQSLTDGSARSLLARRPGPQRVDMGYESTELTPSQRAAVGAAMAMAAEGASPAAAQLAVWEITHDFGDLNIRGGSFSADADEELLAEVDALLSASSARDAAATYARFGTDRGLAVLTTDEGPPAMMADSVMVPLPAPVLIGGAGLALAAAVSRRRTRS